ncbi:MAG: hypothetical protein LBI05_07705 [Planctomycetaceae bacterium]|nr:hypothetical protein [Planctomycetaceae bacterium]
MRYHVSNTVKLTNEKLKIEIGKLKITRFWRVLRCPLPPVTDDDYAIAAGRRMKQI